MIHKLSEMQKSACMIREDTLSLMEVKKLSSLRKEWLTILCLYSTENHPLSLTGWLKSDLKLRIQISHHSNLLLLCSQKEATDLMQSVFMPPYLLSESQFQ